MRVVWASMYWLGRVRQGGRKGKQKGAVHVTEMAREVTIEASESLFIRGLKAAVGELRSIIAPLEVSLSRGYSFCILTRLYIRKLLRVMMLRTC